MRMLLPVCQFLEKWLVVLLLVPAHCIFHACACAFLPSISCRTVLNWLVINGLPPSLLAVDGGCWCHSRPISS